MPSPTLFDAYIASSSLWYALRCFCRIYDPEMVIGWFRPPSQLNLIPNDLEVYNVRTDAWGLLAIAGMLLVASGWFGLGALSAAHKRAAVGVDVAHHVLTGLGAWGHYARETHYNTSMSVGVWGCSGLALLGAVVIMAPEWVSGLKEGKRAKTA